MPPRIDFNFLRGRPPTIKNTDRQRSSGRTPMENNQSITVLSENGDFVGKTYPKRAKGLIKKGRAEALTENVIRLGDFRPQDSDFTEEIKMDVLNEQVINNTNEQAVENTVENLWKAFTGKHEFILFNPRNWYDNPDSDWSNRCERYMYQSPDGKMTEIYSLGDWNGNWSEIRSRFIPVDKDTDYTFVFWLNGGENDRYNEVCRMIAVYTDSEEQNIPDEEWRGNYIYKLNRGGVKPIKNIDGWYLFAIELPKPDKRFLELRFAAQNAPMALKTAEEPSAYENLEDRPDEFADRRPQRHNIFFADGWPADDSAVHGCWYSTGNLKRQRDAGVKHDGQYCSNYKMLDDEKKPHAFNPDGKWGDMLEKLKSIKDIQGHFSFDGDRRFTFSDLAEFAETAEKFVQENGFKTSFRSEHNGGRNDRGSMSIDLDDLAEQVADNLDLDEIAENIDVTQVAAMLDIGGIAEEAAERIDLDDVADRLDKYEIAEAIDIDELAESVAERIDLDDLAEKIAEKLDIKGLLREIFDD